ncbi:alpha-D-ribose 1-methylphosphonate 5-phosphate C-P lyase (plasmid) [Thermus thermophilus]|uniref:alpha-D-ribose 1-methylphosphonate 5-phosphate C-P-lyase PhnJ n=1 Tax=Thermus thermophilus TaxID=274 RepID=UPI001FCBE470|nr:alpha-D-ribose 1-methylphosphonate 5-phosphate C-P-lyase PhnJ [Thermus thermophilus]BDG20179.1 alpha-D-ribose 1-methylphosphonate 5-phosphate C-P lyase [Thermus thermophilus]BDG22735.1 alpha-D-ribose 1-methylphosphonate 5-phosphate C-P lyase [Thermus thermophilus]BDG29801.1 alpha-D-ribose 1-methylphosphonate 5-phosphate C-P lyase [Thermus thermophilus]
MPWKRYSYAFLDPWAKREVRRRILKAVAIPGYQVPFASREMPVARGWGTGALQITLSLVGPRDVVKVMDQGADDSVNAANLRRFIREVSGARTTTDALEATLIQTRHRIPEERLGEGQVLVLQVPIPEPLRYVEPAEERARERHALGDYTPLWVDLFEEHLRRGRSLKGAAYPVLVHGRYVMDPSPLPRFDLPKLHMARHLSLFGAGREKRIYAVPPYTRVEPLAFPDRPFAPEPILGRCRRTGANHVFLNAIPQEDGGVAYEISDQGYMEKLLRGERPGPLFVEVGRG